jgi:hypothetical protein
MRHRSAPAPGAWMPGAGAWLAQVRVQLSKADNKAAGGWANH